MLRVFFIILSLVFFSSNFNSVFAAAEEQYISDEIGVTMRSGPNNKFRVIGKLPAGSPVTILATDQQNKTSQVRSNGQTGWIKTEYLTQNKTVRALYQEAINENNQLKQRAQSLNQQVADNQNIITLNDQLQQQVSQLQNEVDTLTQQSNLQKDRFRSDMFITGGLTVLISMFIAWLITRASYSRRQRSGWR